MGSVRQALPGEATLMRFAFRGTVTFDLQRKKQVAKIDGVTFSTAFGKDQYTTEMHVHYRGATYRLVFSFPVDPKLSERQKVTYLEGLFADRLNIARQTWPSPWPDITSSMLLEIRSV
jgi:hypothetical protein